MSDFFLAVGRRGCLCSKGLAGGTGAIANIIGLLVGGILYSSLQGWLFIISGLLTFLLTLLALYARHSKASRRAV